MGKSSPKVPAAPDPAKTAAAQSQTNKDTAYWNAVLNNVNQITPYGTLSYEQTGGGKTYNMDAYNKALDAYSKAPKPQTFEQWKSTYGGGDRGAESAYGQYLTSMGGAKTAPKMEDFISGDAPPSFTSTIKLSPEQQQLLDIQNRSNIATANLGEQQIGRIGQAVSTPFSFGGLGDAPTAGDIAGQQQRAEEALMARMNPQFGQDEEALRTRLINQGITQGSEAYRREMEQFNQAKNDARMQAVLSGQQYGSTAQAQEMARRNQAIQEYTTQRNAPLNEYIGLTSGTQVQNPQFSSQSYAGAAAPDYASLVNQQYQSQMAGYNAKVAQQNATTQGLMQLGGMALGGFGGGAGSLFSLGGAPAAAIGGGPFNAAAYASGLPWSDIRLKTDIESDGEENGHKMYRFKYIGDDTVYRGVMAQDIEETYPEAVITMPNGFKAVNYGMLGVSMEMV